MYSLSVSVISYSLIAYLNGSIHIRIRATYFETEDKKFSNIISYMFMQLTVPTALTHSNQPVAYKIVILL